MSKNTTIPKEEEPKQELDKIERAHIAILKEMALPCTSNKRKFTDRSRLDKVMELLNHSSYRGESLPLSDIYMHKDLKTKDIILVTAHCDTIPTKPFVSFHEDTGLLHGTFDNLVSNAVLTTLMLEDEIPNNIVFAFTGDEETGKCGGCRKTVSYLKKSGYRIKQAIALDVTWEGYNTSNFSFENFGRRKDAYPDTPLIHAYKKITEECTDSVNTPMGMYDEGYALFDAGIKESGSFCIPVRGNMHGNEGCYCKQKTFEGYILALSSFLYTLTKSKASLVSEYKMMREKLKPTPPPPVTTYSSSYSHCSAYPMGSSYEEAMSSFGERYDWFELEDYQGYYDEYDCDFSPMNDWEAEDYLSDTIDMYEVEDKELFLEDMLHTPELFGYFESNGLFEQEEIEAFLSERFDSIKDYENIPFTRPSSPRKQKKDNYYEEYER